MKQISDNISKINKKSSRSEDTNSAKTLSRPWANSHQDKKSTLEKFKLKLQLQLLFRKETNVKFMYVI